MNRFALLGLFIVSFTILLACSGSGFSPGIEPRILANHYVGLDVLARSAPVIVVGKLQKMESASEKTQAVVVDQKVELRLDRLEVEVETILKGAINNAKVISIKRYSWIPTSDSDRKVVNALNPRYPETGHRYVFFIEPSGNAFRSTVDVTRSQVDLMPSLQSFEPSGSPEGDIATLLLSEPSATFAGDFAQSLRMAALDASAVAGGDRTLKLLRRLLQSRSEEIRNESCLTIVDRFWGQGSCLSAVTAAYLTEEEKSTIDILSERASQNALSVRQKFFANPIDFISRYGDTAWSRCNELGVLTMFEDPDVQHRASRLLNEMFPDYQSRGCLPAKNAIRRQG